MAVQSERQYLPIYFDFVDSVTFDRISPQALKLYIILRRYVCRSRDGHSLSDFYVKGALAVSGFLNQYAKRLGVSKQTISRWIKELEDARFLITYSKAQHDQSIENPNVWLLGRVLHIEGSEYGVDLFFADHDALAQEYNEDTAKTFDSKNADVIWASMPATESAIDNLIKIEGGVPSMEHRMEHRMERSNIEEVIEKTNSNRLSEKTAKPAEKEFLGVDDDFRKVYYYRDKETVSAVNSFVRPPWIVNCSCGNDVQVDSLDEPYECLCGMHEYVLTKTKPKVSVQREHEAVEAYLLISGRKKHTIAQEWLDEIANTVTDLPFWRIVVKEYCGRGWNRGNIAKMLEYYTDRKIPGERTQKEPEQPAEPVVVGRGPDVDYVPGKGWVKHE